MPGAGSPPCATATHGLAFYFVKRPRQQKPPITSHFVLAELTRPHHRIDWRSGRLAQKTGHSALFTVTIASGTLAQALAGRPEPREKGLFRVCPRGGSPCIEIASIKSYSCVSVVISAARYL